MNTYQIILFFYIYSLLKYRCIVRNMKMKPQKFFFALLSNLFLLCACGGQSQNKQTYDGREFDISVNNDGSLICTSTKENNYYQLTISGSGASKDYERKELVPWNPIVKKVNKVTINEGITNIGDYFFNSLTLDSYVLPKTVLSVGDHSFNKGSVIYTFGSKLENIDNDVYYYSETKPTDNGKYFYVEGDEIVEWPVIPATPLSYLFIGNSFTYRGDYGTETNPEVVNYFVKIAKNLGIEVNVDYVVKGSHTLTKFANPDDEMGKIVEQKLTSNKYDYVILQEQSTTPINNYNTFLTAIKKLKTRINQTQTNCTTVLYETWGTPYNTSNDPTTYGSTPGAMEAKLRTAYMNAGEEAGCKVNYIGKAFTYAYETEKINIYNASDNRHQNGLGAYLSAACHVRSFYGVKVSHCTDYCDLSETECKTLLGVADTQIK